MSAEVWILISNFVSTRYLKWLLQFETIEPIVRIELTSRIYKIRVLPLNYTGRAGPLRIELRLKGLEAFVQPLHYRPVAHTGIEPVIS